MAWLVLVAVSAVLLALLVAAAPGLVGWAAGLKWFWLVVPVALAIGAFMVLARHRRTRRARWA